MKTPMHPLLTSAAFLFGILAGHCIAASQVAMDLTGQVLETGSTLSVTSTDSIDPAFVYNYSISGTVIAPYASDFEGVTGTTGVGVQDALSWTNAAMVPYLQANVLDVSGKLPFTAFSKLTRSTFPFSVYNPFGPIDATAYATMFGKLVVNRKGICHCEFNDISYVVRGVGVKTFRFSNVNHYTFINGQVLVQTVPVISGTQPDLSFVTPTGLVGYGIVNTTGSGQALTAYLQHGKSATYVVALQNSGSIADTFTLSATPATSDFTQEFIYNGRNITAEVTGTTGGFTIPPDKGGTAETLASGAVTTLTWKLTDKSSDEQIGTAPILTAASKADPTQQDVLVLSGTAE